MDDRQFDQLVQPQITFRTDRCGTCGSLSKSSSKKREKTDNRTAKRATWKPEVVAGSGCAHGGLQLQLLVGAHRVRHPIAELLYLCSHPRIGGSVLAPILQ